ncbi:hypothetical protein McaMca56_003739 [Microsporum canis]
MTRDWVSLWVLNYIFDASYYDVFTILSCGTILCIAPQDDILSDLAGHLNDMGVEQVMLTPTITKLIRGGALDVPRLKVLNVCGEKIDINILDWAKSVDVYNGLMYYDVVLCSAVRVSIRSTNNRIFRHVFRAVELGIPAQAREQDDQLVEHGRSCYSAIRTNLNDGTAAIAEQRACERYARI